MQESTMLQTGNGLLGPKVMVLWCYATMDLHAGSYHFCNRAYSILLDVRQQMDHELQQSFPKFNNGKTPCSGENGSSDVARTVRCACCEVAEDCTAAYIRRVRAAHCGTWVCGLCAEAVGERLRHELGAGVEAALRWHMAVCRDFNTTTRLNPKLSLAGSMRDIARRSFNRRRSSSTATCHDELCSANKTMARSISCQPRFFV